MVEEDQLDEQIRLDEPARPEDYFSLLLVSHPSGELRKELPSEVAGVVWVVHILAAKIIVKDSSVGGFVDVGQAEIHAVAFDGARHAADEDHGAIRLLPFDNPNVRQRVVHLPIPVVVPCIVEEDEIAGMGNRPLVECALLLYVCIDEADAVSFRIALAAAVQIDPVSEKNRTGYSRTIISDTPTVALDCFGAHELGRCPRDLVPARYTFDGSATGAHVRW